ncbi:MAG: hypothetical protein G8345_04865 [Magnetococcales bacterium]|nr:hypothetical protein [Magnetococcales bacterium]NGZ26202.1 hypothetical protein [Magnetococcales bacterium]
MATFGNLTLPLLHKIANLSLRTRIFGLIFISLISTAVLVAGSVYFLHHLGMELRMLVETNLPISKTLSSVEIHQLDHSLLLMKDHSEPLSGIEKQRHLKAMDKFFQFLDDIDQDLTKSRIMAEEAVDKVASPTYRQYFQEVASRLSMIDQRQHRLAFLIKETFQHIERKDFAKIEENKSIILDEKSLLLLDMKELLMFIQTMNDTSLHGMEEQYDQLLVFLPIAISSIFLIIFVLARTVLHYIVNPLKRAIEAANALTKEHTLMLEHARVGGEMGQLLQALDHLAVTLQERDDLRKRLAISEKMSSIGRLAVGVAHEINNPLASATVGLQNLQTRIKTLCQDPEVHQKFQQVERSIQRAGHVAREMLEFSWSGELNMQPVAICDILDMVLEQYSPEESKIKIQRQYHTSPLVCGDEHKIDRIFGNLVQNALDAMPDGGTLTVSVTRPFPRWVIVTIQDTGVGIALESQSKILEPFFTTKQLGKGTGLGLPICASLVEQHHGHLQINSMPGQGTSVVVTLPTWKEQP